MSRSAQTTPASLTFWILTAFLAVVFLTGGASRADVESLFILRPLSVIVCAGALITLKREQLRGRKGLFTLFAAIMLLVLLHLVPLPPSIWQNLPGRKPFVEIDHLVGLGDIWRPLTLTPANGWNAFASLFTPLAVLLVGVQLGRDDLYRLLPVFLLLGLASALLGLAQAIGGPESGLYLYRVTNNGTAVGLFANRNHAAVLLVCLFPILAVFASTAVGTADQQRARLLASIAIGIVLIPLILVTGSRAGVLTGIVGLLSTLLLYRKPAEGRATRRGEKALPFGIGTVVGGAVVIALGLVTVFYARADAIDRLLNESVAEGGRTDFWEIGIGLFSKYFPFGSGVGSVREIFEIDEPDRLLDPYFLNHLHNDWLEIPVTLGLPGLVLLGGGLLAVCSWTLRAWRSQDGDRRWVKVAKLASLIILILALASIGDYPLRTPIMMALGAVVLLWLTLEGKGRSVTVAEQGDANG